MIEGDSAWRGYFPCSREELEPLLRALVATGVEGKVDFKEKLSLETAADRAKFAQLVAAIANTDDAAHDDWGFIVVGAKQGALVGGAEQFDASRSEKLSTELEDQLRRYLIPPPRIGVVAYEDPVLGRWGAVVVRPSSEQPHLIVREHAGETQVHDCWVRVGSSTQRAAAHDYARFFEKRVRRATRELERELSALQARVRQLEAQTLPRGRRSSPVAPERASSSDPLTVLVSLLRTPERDVADILLARSAALFAHMTRDSEDLPWRLGTFDAAACRRMLVTIELAARPFVEAIVLVLERDAQSDHDGAIVDAVRMIAREPEPAHSPYNPILVDVRSYPLALVVYAVATVAAVVGRGHLLRRVFELEFETRQQERFQAKVVEVPRRLMAAHDFFQAASATERLVAPVSNHLLEVLSAWLGPYVRGRDVGDALAVGEFIVALGFLVHGHDGWPLPATYLYSSSAARAIERFLRRRPQVLEELFGSEVGEVLSKFDASAHDVVKPLVGGRGFQGGALAIWKPQSSKT